MVNKAVREGAKTFKKLGAQVEEVSVPQHFRSPLSFAEWMRMLPPSSLTVPDVQVSRVRFFMEELCSRRCSDGRSGRPAEGDALGAQRTGFWGTDSYGPVATAISARSSRPVGRNAFDRAFVGADGGTRQGLHHGARTFRIGDPFLVEVVGTDRLAAHILARIYFAGIGVLFSDAPSGFTGVFSALETA